MTKAWREKQDSMLKKANSATLLAASQTLNQSESLNNLDDI